MWTLVGITQTVPSAIAHAGAAQIQPVRHPLMQGQNYEPMTLAQGDSTVFNWTGAQFGLAANTEASACFRRLLEVGTNEAAAVLSVIITACCMFLTPIPQSTIPGAGQGLHGLWELPTADCPSSPSDPHTVLVDPVDGEQQAGQPFEKVESMPMTLDTKCCRGAAASCPLTSVVPECFAIVPACVRRRRGLHLHVQPIHHWGGERAPLLDGNPGCWQHAAGPAGACKQPHEFHGCQTEHD